MRVGGRLRARKWMLASTPMKANMRRTFERIASSIGVRDCDAAVDRAIALLVGACEAIAKIGGRFAKARIDLRSI